MNDYRSRFVCIFDMPSVCNTTKHVFKIALSKSEIFGITLERIQEAASIWNRCKLNKYTSLAIKPW